MANAVKYSGLCEACDHDRDCMLKRIRQFEIIECEQFCTHPVVNNVSAMPAKATEENPVEVGEGKE